MQLWLSLLSLAFSGACPIPAADTLAFGSPPLPLPWQLTLSHGAARKWALGNLVMTEFPIGSRFHDTENETGGIGKFKEGE